MMNLTLTYPFIDPIFFSLGPIVVRWYGIAYVMGIMLGWALGLRLLKTKPNGLAPQHFDDVVVWVIVGIVVGGRLGQFLFYDPQMFWTNPQEILMIWRGGMSFHGGILGVLIATLIFAKSRQAPFWSLMDTLATVTPLGIFFGRIANFINGELYGRVTDVSWGVIFPHAGPLPRHPSQIYEAILEGLVLFIVMLVCWHRPNLRLKPGRLTGIAAIGYALARSFIETFREPDGIAFGALTFGQMLCIPLFGLGWFLLRRPVTPHANPTP